MHGKMIFVLLLSATRQRYPHNFSQPVITVIIFSVMAVIIGIILISAKLIGLLIKRNPTLGTSDPLTSVKIGETEYSNR
uniref:Glycophorin-A n=1 Tax=Balaenoptera musculus TaxID=9771 RepID=A0A8C0HUE2_BALMU